MRNTESDQKPEDLSSLTPTPCYEFEDKETGIIHGMCNQGDIEQCFGRNASELNLPLVKEDDARKLLSEYRKSSTGKKCRQLITPHDFWRQQASHNHECRKYLEVS